MYNIQRDNPVSGSFAGVLFPPADRNLAVADILDRAARVKPEVKPWISKTTGLDWDLKSIFDNQKN
jgi:hypothetical protein